MIRVFPALPRDKPARFFNLRAQGGFLVSASQSAGKVEQIAITSTVGGRLRLLSPWPTISVGREDTGHQIVLRPDARGVVELDTHPVAGYVNKHSACLQVSCRDDAPK